MGKAGPSTDAGKARSAQNARKHGALSALPVVPGLESAADWESHYRGIVDGLAPVGSLEAALAGRVALLLWRLRRVARYEMEMIAVSQETVGEDWWRDKGRRSNQFLETPARPEELRGRLKQLRLEQRAFRRFPSLGDDAGLTGGDAATILCQVADAAGIDLDDLRLPDIPSEGCEDLAEVPGWTAGKVRACLSAIAKAAKQPVTGLLRHVQVTVEGELTRVKSEAAEMAREVDQLQRQRLLPEEAELSKVSRYEAHLSRELSRALRELETLQHRRQERSAASEGIVVEGVLAEPCALPGGVRPALPEATNCETNSDWNAARSNSAPSFLPKS